MKLLIDWDGGSKVVNPGNSFVIGRDKAADIQVVGSKVSRTHLRLEFDGVTWKATDLDSSNGSFIAGKPFQQVEIKDQISIFLGGMDGEEIRLHPLEIVSTKGDTKKGCDS